MATYLELAGIKEQANWNDFLNKVRVAAAINAQDIIDSASPTQTAIDWAKATLADKNEAGAAIADYLVAKFNTSSVATILGAADADIQTQVGNVVDILYP